MPGEDAAFIKKLFQPVTKPIKSVLDAVSGKTAARQTAKVIEAADARAQGELAREESALAERETEAKARRERSLRSMLQPQRGLFDLLGGASGDRTLLG